MDHRSPRLRQLATRGAAFLFLSCLAGCNRPRTPSELPRPADVVRIRLEVREPDVFIRPDAPTRAAVLEDRRDIEKLLSLADFSPKPPCGCAHLEEVVFETATRAVEASICGHCFDVRADGRTACYAMTPGFYSAFQDLLARRAAPAAK